MDIQDIIKEAIIIGETATFKEAIELMVKKRTNSVLVVNTDGVLTGEIHISDILDAIVPEYLDGDSIAAHFTSGEMFEEAVKDASDIQVQWFMSKDVTAIEPSDGLMSVAATAIAKKKAHIPVVDSAQHPIGIISRRGIKHIIAGILGIRDTED